MKTERRAVQNILRKVVLMKRASHGRMECRAVFEMRGGGGGGLTPHTCTGPWHLCFPRGPKVGPLKTPPPPKYQNVFYELFQAPISITRNKTCYTDKWVTLKTVPVA